MVRKFFSFAIAALVTAALSSQAEAGWASWGGSYGSGGGSWGSNGSHGSHGSWGASGGSWGSHGSRGGWGSHGSHGRHVGIFKRWRMRHHSSGGSWGSHGSRGSWGSHGSSGGSWGSSGGSSGGSWGSNGGSSGGSYEIHGEGGVMEEDPPVAPADEAVSRSDRGVLTVEVPQDAKITVNGNTTKRVGALRRYGSNGLKPNLSYRYTVTASIEQDGQTIERTEVATLRGGRTAHLAFDFDKAPAVETRLTLNVPEDAQVLLSGVKTKSTGDVRQFVTKKLANGEKWADYHVVVSVERDGQRLSKEKTVSLAGGDQVELTFGFDNTTLADAR